MTPHSLRFLHWLFPAKQINQVTDLDLVEIKTRYQRLDSLGNTLSVVVLIVAAIAYSFALESAFQLSAHGLEDSPFLIRPHRLEFVICAGFLSLLSSYYLLLCMVRWQLGAEEFLLYSTYGSYV